MNRYQRRSWYVWNSTGDRATLKNASGTVQSRCSCSGPNDVLARLPELRGYGENFAAVTC